MNSIIIVCAAVGGLVIGGVVVWAFMVRGISRLHAALAARETELAAERKGRIDDRAMNERINAEREKTVKEQLKGMLAEMSNLAAETLEKRERALAEKNEEQVRSLLAPMHLKLEDFRKAAEESKKANGDLSVKIGEFFRNIKATSESFGAEAKSFTDALKGANKKQGDWGESILRQILEDCGLRAGEGFFEQTGSGSGIPDCQVADPSSMKMLIVDSKMSWTKYEQAYKLPEGEERRAAMKEHVASVRRHIDELSKADYPHTQICPKPGYSYVPLTAMFVPCNAALEAALEEDPSIVDYALKKDVALVSPLTLFGFLVLVSRAWSRYSIDRNSSRIYEEAKKLVGYVDRLFRNLEDMGGHLKKTAESYDAVMAVAAKDPEGQCIKGPALRILDLGARPDRALKSKTMTSAGDDGRA